MDAVGLAVMLINLFPLPMLCLLPTSMFFNIDPGYHIMKTFSTESTWYGLLVRYTTIQWVCVEGARTYTIWLSSVIVLFFSTHNILVTIFNQRLSIESISSYRKLLIITESMRHVTRRAFGLLMSAGFFMAVFLNFLVIACHDTIPGQLYAFACMMSLILYQIMFFSFPIGEGSYVVSHRLLKSKWPDNLAEASYKNWRHQQKCLQKTVVAMRPVVYYYGIAVFHTETKTNFCWNLLEYTINLLLVQ